MLRLGLTVNGNVVGIIEIGDLVTENDVVVVGIGLDGVCNSVVGNIVDVRILDVCDLVV